VSILGRVFRVQPGEGGSVGLLVALMATVFAGSTIGESATSALFFDRIGADALPVMYLAQGATGLLAMLVLTGALGRADQRRAYVVLPLAIVALVLVERAVVAADPGWIYPVLWLTVSLATLVQAIFVWGVAGLVTDTRRAKRLFPLFSAGGILGAVAGGLITRPLSQMIGVENLLVVWAAALGGAAMLCAAALRTRRSSRTRPKRRRPLARRHPSAWRELRQGLAFVRRSTLLVWMTAAAVLFSVLFFSLYLPFAQESAERFRDPDDLAGFFGIFWAGVTAAAFLVSMLLTNRLLGWFGAAMMVIVLPVLYAASFGILLASSAFATLVAIRFAVIAWMQGVASPAWETLVNVVPDTRRDQTRAFLNGGPTQVGTAIAGLTQLIGQQALSARQLSLIGLGAAAITAFVTWRIRRSYVAALVDALRAGRPSVFEGEVIAGSPIVLEADGQALDLALEASRDSDPRVRRLAVEMLSAGYDDRVRGTLAAALDDEDPLVRANAVRGLERGGGSQDEPLFDRALGDDDAAVRLAAVLALGRRSDEETAWRSLGPVIADMDPAVAAAASVALLRGSARPEAVTRLRSMLSDDDPEIRVAALDWLQVAAPEDVEALAAPMWADPSPAVRAAALHALAAAGSKVAFGPAVEGLGADEPSIRAAAIETLAGLDIRAHRAELQAFAEARASLASEDHALASAVPPHGAAPQLLRDALLDRGRRNAIVALTALALLSEDRDAMRAALDNLDAADPGQLANALETLEVTAGTSLARPLLGLWETTPGGSKAGGSDDWLDRALGDDHPFIRSCAELVQTTRERGDDMTRSRPSMSPMERVIALRKVPLFAGLSSTDLYRVAGIADECIYADGDVIATEGETGDELHIVVVGAVRVIREGDLASTAIARRGAGDVVGEMSIITRAPRIASLIAEGDVRTVRIGRREFESMIRERPDVSLAVMRVLAERLGVETAGRPRLDTV